jgi:uncharacterized protein (TIGR04551 family)
MAAKSARGHLTVADGLTIVRRPSRIRQIPDVFRTVGDPMTRLAFRRTGPWAALILLAVPAAALAQVGPGLPGGAPGEEEDKKDGVAEAAPKTPGLLPTTPVLPPPKSKRMRFSVFELGGYFRLRSDYFKNLNLSFDDRGEGGAPFPRPAGCAPASPNTPGAAPDRPCGDTIKGTNLRLRLEPRVNVDERISVHAQIDVLDNVVLGADAPQSLRYGSEVQRPPENSIVARRAWAEVQTPLGILKLGRQPWHWGLGIHNNGGAEDPINGLYDYDGDFGDTVDRVSFGTLIPGTRLRGGIAYDWPVGGPSAAHTDQYRGRIGGQPWDLTDDDDIDRWVLVVSRMDAPSDFRDTLDRGGLALNWGIQFAYETQSWAYTGSPAGEPFDPDAFVPRDATVYTPDLWLKVGYGALLLEAEAVAVFGSINRATDLGFDIGDRLSIRQFGGVGRFTVRALEDKLRFGVEVGAASGDQYDNDPPGNTHLSNAVDIDPRFGDRRLSRFAFDPDYKVDLILFRELIGAVSNAAYGKPFLSYELTRAIGLRVANVTSFALRPVATPGNARMWGTEFDADLAYRASRFELGAAYGVLFPLAAMNHPADPGTGPGFGFEGNTGTAGNAHTFQVRAVVKF